MKNYWLVAGGISIGAGLAFLAENSRLEKVKSGALKEDSQMTNGQATGAIVVGVLIILGGIYGFKK